MEKVLLAEWGRGVDSGGDNSLDGDGGGGGDGEDGGCGGGDGEGGGEMRISFANWKIYKICLTARCYYVFLFLSWFLFHCYCRAVV